MPVVIPTEADSVIGSFKVNISDFPVNGALLYHAADADLEAPAWLEFKFTATDDFKKSAAELLGLTPATTVIAFEMTETSCSLEAGPVRENP